MPDQVEPATGHQVLRRVCDVPPRVDGIRTQSTWSQRQPDAVRTIDVDRLAELYRGAACLVQSSRYEGFGLPVLEAMACGAPVVAVPEAALQEVAGDAAVLVPETRLAEGIRRALEEREQLVAAGLERARAFSWRAAAERTLAAYREILGT